MDNVNTQTFVTSSESQTRALGARIARSLKAGDVVLIEGDLGAGKTVITQGICAGLGISENIPVRSPTFTLIHEYPHDPPVRHADLYRLDDGAEAENIGLFDDTASRITIIEWAEKLPPEMKHGAITIKIEPLSENERKIMLSAPAAALDIINTANGTT
ncbi:MAG: tRNA (adenosine(37)-N6)-threonylcarbamoyltransferase complex ATPase subunit type 1 TsaE [Nitrospinae bacterium]|nr:tRNA (adenosine(37)-N6)-threonylcarbamoyltransferase complex ATPase subunit type 1 TsaE [Nitrospinota bacterium]